MKQQLNLKNVKIFFTLFATATFMSLTSCDKTELNNEIANDTQSNLANRACTKDFRVKSVNGGAQFYFYGDVCSTYIGDPYVGEGIYWDFEVSGGGSTCPTTYPANPLGTYYVFPNGYGSTPYIKIVFTSGFTNGSSPEAVYNTSTNNWTWDYRGATGVTVTKHTSWTNPC